MTARGTDASGAARAAGAAGLAAGLAAALGAAPIAGAAPPGPSAATTLTAEPAAVELGAIALVPAGGRATATLVLRAGPSGAQIASLGVDGGEASAWSVASTCAAGCALGPGATTTAKVTFSPRRHGPLDASLRVALASPAGASVAVPLRGEGLGATLAAAPATPATLDLGEVPVGAGATTAALTLRNAGNLDVDVALAFAAGAPASLAAVPAQVRIPAAGTTTVQVGCEPQAPGALSGRLVATAAGAYLGSPVELTIACRGTTAPTRATPSALHLGEVRVGGEPRRATVRLTATAPGASLVAARLQPAVPGLELVLPALPAAVEPGGAGLALELAAAPAADGELATALVLTDGAGGTTTVPVSGRAVTAVATAPPVVDFGTVCTSGAPPPPALPAALEASGTGSVRVRAPALLAGPGSPFRLRATSPSTYPADGALLGPGERALAEVQVTPPASVGTYADTVAWTTDLPGAGGAPATVSTPVVLQVIASGGALSPSSIDFGVAPTHTVSAGRPVTVQNCGADEVIITSATVRPPFEVRDLALPRTLPAGSVETFSVTFAPTSPGAFEDRLVLDVMGASAPTLAVALSGRTAAGSPPDDAGPPGHGSGDDGGCGCRAPGRTSGAGAAGLAGLAALVQIARPRRRARARSARGHRPPPAP